MILEPVAVTPNGKEHPKQLCVHLPESVGELKKIVNVIHAEKRLACLHLNHAGAAANPKASGGQPKAPGWLGAANLHPALRRQSTTQHPMGVEQRKTGLDARRAPRDAGKVIAAAGLLAFEEEGAVIGGDGVYLAGGESGP